MPPPIIAMPDSSDSATARPVLDVGGSIWLQSGTRTLGGAGRIALLAAIRDSGSITGAAKAVGMSYKAAWDAVDTMNNLAGEPLVLRTTGGRGGGGTTLTPRALKLIDTFAAVEHEHRRFLEKVGRGIDDFETDWQLIGRLGMKTSARNQLYGTVTAVQRGAVNDEVLIGLAGGQTIAAVLTHESTEALGLAVGGAAFALIKASWVIVLAGEAGGAKLSARNQLAGKVADVKPGAVNTEVSIELPGGPLLTAIITNASVAHLGLAKGVPAVAAFKASSVIVGVDA